MSRILKKSNVVLALIGVVLFGVFYMYGRDTNNQRDTVPEVGTKNTGYKDIEYRIDGTPIKLNDGFSEIEAAPGSASKITTRYFGNDFKTDLNNDGQEDVVFLLTQETGGSGVFYYVVAALNLGDRYIGSDGYLLGDRVAPQTIETSSNEKHKNVIVVNYADRAIGDAMTAPPSVGKSTYLKLDVASMVWGIAEPNFEGESSE